MTISSAVQAAQGRSCAIAMTVRRVPTDGSLHIVGISGSLRKGSHNTKLLVAAQQRLPKGVTMEIADISDLPLLNTDLEQPNPAGPSPISYPESVERFRQQVAVADALLFCTPEYNYSIPAPLKNALDWGSRPSNVFAQKPAAVMSIAGGFSGILGMQALRQCGVFLDLLFLQKPGLWINQANGLPFDEDGNLNDPDIEKRLGRNIDGLIAWTERLRT